MSEAEDIEFVENQSQTMQVGTDEKVVTKIAQLKQEIQQIQQSIVNYQSELETKVAAHNWFVSQLPKDE